MAKEREKGALSLEGLNGQLSKASAMMGLYEKHASTVIRSNAELEHVQREMGIIKAEILSALMHSRKALQALIGQCPIAHSAHSGIALQQEVNESG